MTRARREFPAKVKAQAFERAGGRCEKCGVRLGAGKVHYDHTVPDALGGEPILSNCAVLCRPCHGAKTAKSDVPRIAKAKRQQAFHVGAKPPSRTPMPCGRNSPVKRRMRDGVIVDRATGQPVGRI